MLLCDVVLVCGAACQCVTVYECVYCRVWAYDVVCGWRGVVSFYDVLYCGDALCVLGCVVI